MDNTTLFKNHTSKLSVIIPLCMVIFIDTFAMTLIYPLFAPLFSLDIAHGGIFSTNVTTHIKDLLYGLTMAIYPIFTFFTGPLLGDLSDNVGRKKVILLCLLGAAIAAGISGLGIILHSFILFFISRMIAGGVAGSLPVAQAAIADISDEHDKAVNISLVGFAFTLGLILGPIIGGLLSNNNLVHWFSFTTPFFATAILSLCNAVILVFIFRETLTKIGRKISWATIRILKPLVMFAQAMKSVSIRNVILVCFFYILAWNIYLQFTALYLFQKFHFTSAQIGYFVSWIAIVMSVTMIVIIRFLVKFLTTLQILYCAIALSILGILISMLPSSSIQWVGCVPIALGIGLAYTSIITLFSNSVSADLQGWIMGISTSAMSAAAGIGGVLLGFVSIHFTLTFVTIIIALLLCYTFTMQIKQ